MKNIVKLTSLASLSSLTAAMLLTGCAAQKNTPQHASAPDAIYQTTEEIQAMPACKAVVVERGPCFVCLRTTDGKEFYIGSPASNAEVVRFLNALKAGRTYRFPQTFIEYQEQRRRAVQ